MFARIQLIAVGSAMLGAALFVLPGVAGNQAFAEAVVREHSGGSASAIPPTIRCSDYGCRELQNGRWVKVYPKVRDHRTQPSQPPRSGGKKGK